MNNMVDSKKRADDLRSEREMVKKRMNYVRYESAAAKQLKTEKVNLQRIPMMYLVGDVLEPLSRFLTSTVLFFRR